MKYSKYDITYVIQYDIQNIIFKGYNIQEYYILFRIISSDILFNQ